MSDPKSPQKPRPSNIGELSGILKYDVRDLLVEDYTMEQIYEVVDGKITLDELFKQKPKGKPQW